MIIMRNKENKKCNNCNKEVVEKKVKTQQKGKDYYEEVEKKELETPSSEDQDENQDEE